MSRPILVSSKAPHSSSFLVFISLDTRPCSPVPNLSEGTAFADLLSTPGPLWLWDSRRRSPPGQVSPAQEAAGTEIFAKSPSLPHHAQTAPLPSAVHTRVQESASDPHSLALRRVSSPPAKHGQDPKSVHKMITFIERVIFF